jgi:hypothetical protein
MSFVRFVIRDLDCDSGRRRGLFQALADLDDRGELSPEEQRTYDETYEWFRKNLRKPRSFTRSSKPHAKKVALSWFRHTATEHVRRMRDLASILEAHGIPTEMLRTNRPGYVVYEDRHQVTAEPFGDTGA